MAQLHLSNNRFFCTRYLSERQLHVGVSVEVIACNGLPDLSDLSWGRRTNWLLLLCGRHLLFMCKEGEKVRHTRLTVMRGGGDTAHTCTDLDVGHREYPDAAPELSLIPVVVYLADDVHSVALLK